MDSGIKCEQAYRDVFQYLDRELSESELAQVRRHLDDCPPCAHFFEFEGTVVRYIKERSPREECPAAAVSAILTGFRARIRARISR